MYNIQPPLKIGFSMIKSISSPPHNAETDIKTDTDYRQE